MSDKMREMFEARFTVPPGVYWNDDRQRYATHYHESLRMAERQRDLWKAWQAAHAAALPPGFVAVPVEPTEYMLEAAEESLRDHGFDAVDVGEFDKAAMWADFQTMGQYRMALLAAAKEHDARQAGIVRAVVLAYKEGRNGEAYHPGYTPHEAAAFEIGQRERR